MTTLVQSHTDLITRLIVALIDEPRAMTLRSATMPRRMNWFAKVAINDTGKLVGGGARHVRSLRAVLSVMGAKHGEEWRFIAEKPDDGTRRPFEQRPFNPKHQPDAEADLLADTLEAMLTTLPAIDVEGEDGDYKFTIQCQTPEDYETMATPVLVGFEKMTPIAAIGILWKAYGLQKGVIYMVDMPKPKQQGARYLVELPSL